MRTPASLVHRTLYLLTFGTALFTACGDDASKNGETGGASGDSGASGASTGGKSSGGASTGGKSNGGASGATATGGDSGSDTGGNGGGGDTDSGGGGTSAGTDSGGTTSSGGTAGDATGGMAGSATGGTAGSGGTAGTPSSGCGKSGTPANGRVTIDVGGTMREYIIKIPAAYDSSHPYRLILAFHGRAYSAQTVADGGPPGTGASAGPYYGIEAASGGSAILVAPQALSSSWTDANGRDTAYVNAMVTRFKSELCIDENRVFATGFSMGAIMTITLGCNSDGTFRAIAPMSGSLPASCDGELSVAYWASHGTNDMTILPAQGEAARNAFLVKNGCSMQTVPGDRAGCVNYENCDADAPVTWCSFTGVHEPPPYAGEAIWAFLSQF